MIFLNVYSTEPLIYINPLRRPPRGVTNYIEQSDNDSELEWQRLRPMLHGAVC